MKKQIVSWAFVLLLVICSLFIYFRLVDDGNSVSDIPVQNLDSEKSEINYSVFIGLKDLIQSWSEFNGSAFASVLPGSCKMILTNNTQGEGIVKLRYERWNQFQNIYDLVDQTFVVTDLNRENSRMSNGYYGLNNVLDYEEDFLFGKVNELNFSLNNGQIQNGDGEGKIWFLLDKHYFRLEYILIENSPTNNSFNGTIQLDLDSYLKAYCFFKGRDLSIDEKTSIKDFYELQTKKREEQLKRNSHK